MRKKQKRVLMIGLGVLAVTLCAVQLGPIFLGGKSKKKKGPQKPVGPRVAKRKGGQPRVAKGGGPRAAPRAPNTGPAQTDVAGGHQTHP